MADCGAMYNVYITTVCEGVVKARCAAERWWEVSACMDLGQIKPGLGCGGETSGEAREGFQGWVRDKNTGLEEESWLGVVGMMVVGL
ncbi:predicted protein [Plenodomus lingam JN3]|uniref:Predicted protein n=1 Tax=Leptosphaeria maculans (strain JN3 / isolate v23.1.3 / race Av1-4-5-6-7-8) TaxID=985895 RepID=E5AER2_LEPMJ|nr:predicted protein [Plenodomus lingam JN3]CBY01701.1 predicted protein [Plenodomus lingam JN3]